MARPGLDRNVKFRNLCRLLKQPRPHVRGYLELLWDVAYENGNPVIGDPASVEAAAEFPGEPGRLFAALLGCGGEGRVGFVEPVQGSDTLFQVHDLMDHAPDYVKKRRKREEERLANAKTADNGGQRRPLADNGKTPTPAPTPAPTPNSGGVPPETPLPGTTAKKSRNKKPPEPPPPIPPELDTLEFRGAWEKWLDYRRDRRVTLRAQTLQEQLAFLAPFGPDGAAAALAASIRNGWQGVFPPKNGSHQGGETMDQRIARAKENLL